MSYTLYYSLGALTVQPNSINSQTSIFLPGEDYVQYGQPVDQSLLSLLQNFANVTPPPRSIPGQLWFDTNDSTMKVTPNGGAGAVWNAIDADGAPGGPNTSIQFNNGGDLGGSANLVFNSTTNTLTVIGNVHATTFTGNLVGNISGNIVAPGSNTQVLFNDGGNVGANSTFVFDKTTGSLGVGNTVTANTFTGNSLALNGNAVINGNLQVTGNVTYINVTNLDVTDPVIGLGRGPNNTPLTTNDGKDRGSQMWYYNGAERSAFSGFDTSTGKMILATNVTVTNDVVTVNSYGNVLVGNIEAASLTTTQITTGASGTAGNITGNWTLTAGSRLESTYADLAEKYVSDAAYESGTVLQFGGDNEVTLADEFTNRVAGVVSTNAAYIMNGDCAGEHIVTLALQGRVPVKVTGPVRKGDMMISAGSGYARACDYPKIGTVIGKSLENFSGGTGTIEVVIGRV